MALGIYISIPFCKSKCSYCNFASGVFSKQVFKRYVDRVLEDVARRELLFSSSAVSLDQPVDVDSIYLGGGTPTLLEPAEIQRLFASLRHNFNVLADAEITVECAPGTLSPPVIDSLLGCGVNRISLGVQSFIDNEASSVARLHTRAITMAEIDCLRAAGIHNINIDLIAGLPHQTEASWDESLSQLIDTGVPHASVYMLEVDEDSRLGRELIAGGTRYHAHFVPDDDLTADLYERACERFHVADIQQYEISNFARSGAQSVHNSKYWTRQPYLGFGVDAHSMLLADLDRQHPSLPDAQMIESVRLATTDNLERYISGTPLIATEVTESLALEEAFFLGLRLNRGVDLEQAAERYGIAATSVFREEFAELALSGLVEIADGCIRLTSRGRLLSNEVFARLVKCNTAPQT